MNTYSYRADPATVAGWTTGVQFPAIAILLFSRLPTPVPGSTQATIQWVFGGGGGLSPGVKRHGH
jgi:hypothetical protein